MQTILCTNCKQPIEISQAIADQVSEEEKKQQAEAIAKAREEERKNAEKKLREEISLREKDYQNEIKENNERIERLMQDVLKANEAMRELRKKDEEREIENQKKFAEVEQKAKEEALKKAEESMKYEILQMKKQLEDTQKSLEEAKRKSEQVSQQLQGEVLELDIENLLRNAFPHDVIEPVGKGVSGADIRHIVKSPLGNTCGVILWELKRTKHWDDKWIGKLKDDLRNEIANVPVIVSQQLPPEAKTGLGVKEKVWVCNFSLIIPLAELLRTNLYDVARQKASQANSTEKAQLIYNYVTSHEFQQQVESMIETYQAMQEQLTKEKIAFERIWKTREAQIHKVLMNTANVIGSIQGKVGASMPTIKGLEILELDSGENI
ncbi:MAG TPA: DUF2130 domain-containing protein [Candidatus Saccharimonadales bacterium]|nr:DUF2130 domain-containing protein [Candidatus Saccharimonadales bacterium]